MVSLECVQIGHSLILFDDVALGDPDVIPCKLQLADAANVAIQLERVTLQFSGSELWDATDEGLRLVLDDNALLGYFLRPLVQLHPLQPLELRRFLHVSLVHAHHALLHLLNDSTADLVAAGSLMLVL